jgi:hypothetical protein
MRLEKPSLNKPSRASVLVTVEIEAAAIRMSARS